MAQSGRHPESAGPAADLVMPQAPATFPRPTRRSDPRTGSLAAWARTAAPLAGLRDAAMASARMWEVAAPLLPAALAQGVRPGRWQRETWTLTASSSAVAAKLSQLKPALVDALQQQGYALQAIRIRVEPQRLPAAPRVEIGGGVPCPPEVLARFRALRHRLG